MVKTIKCELCNKYNLKENNRRKLTNKELQKYVTSITGNKADEHNFICNKCRSRYLREKSSLSHAVITTTDSPCNESIATHSKLHSPRSIELQFSSSSKSHRRCVICKKENNKRHSLVVVPNEARTQIFIEKGTVIVRNSRCCPVHLVGKYFTHAGLTDLESTNETAYFNRTEIADLLERVRSAIKSTGKLNFDLPLSLTDDDYFNLTGITKDQFNTVASHLKQVRNTEIRSARTCLAMLLVKLRTGLSNTMVACLFSVTRHQVQRAIHSARQDLMANFVPHYLGFPHISHSDFVAKHTTPIAKEIFSPDSDSSAILVIDGTYIYIQKSAKHHFQKLTYSLHKNRCLVKPMVVVGTDGYILNALGPYYANWSNNDAQITKHAFKTNQDNFRNWLEESDMFIVDRGFRDVTEFLKENNFNVEMPSFLPKGEKQLTTEDANTSRLVTKVRWVVESTNGRIKQWKFLDNVIPNHYIPYIGDFVKITCSLINCFRAPLVSDFGYESLGKTMLERSKKANHVKEYVENNNLITKRTAYKELSGNSELLDFPRISLQQLRDITMGVYQVKLSAKYTEHHKSDDNAYKLFVCKEKPNLVRVKLKSKHSSSKIYSVWIEYSDSDITGWYCTCKVGARMVGCCCHISSIIWYLGYDRWNENTSMNYDLSSGRLNAANIPSDEEGQEEILSDDNDVIEE